MPRRPQTQLQSQLISEIARITGYPVVEVRNILQTYADVGQNVVMAGKKLPLPGAMGYVYASITRSEEGTIHATLTDSDVLIKPRLRAIATFSKPWKASINDDPRAPELIKRLITDKESSSI